MAQETYDWSLDYSDEDGGATTTFTSGSGDSVEISVSQTEDGGSYTANGTGFETKVLGGDTSGYFQLEANSSNNTGTVSTTIDFANNTATAADSVTDPSFTLYDLDSPSNGNYQDQVTVYAYDVNGNLLPVTLSATDPSVVSVSGATATAVLGGGSGGSQPGNVDNADTEGNVEVSISGEVSRIVVVYGNGPDARSNPTTQQIGISDLSFDLQAGVICFARGTLIATPDGERPIEALTLGDLVLTEDRGPQPIRWIGVKQVPARGRLAPVRFPTGALGNRRPLLVSPQHRLLLSNAATGLYLGESECLASAEHLVGAGLGDHAKSETVTYHHLMFERHEIIRAEGARCESLQISETSLSLMGAAARQEFRALFPDLFRNPSRFGALARPALRRHETLLVA